MSDSNAQPEKNPTAIEPEPPVDPLDITIFTNFGVLGAGTPPHRSEPSRDDKMEKIRKKREKDEKASRRDIEARMLKAADDEAKRHIIRSLAALLVNAPPPRGDLLGPLESLTGVIKYLLPQIECLPFTAAGEARAELDKARKALSDNS
jgi:hypothetical protein